KLYESLTRMYGLPGTTDPDPTAMLSIFFTLFFAICIADAGYGVILAILSLIDIKLGGKIGKVLFGINFKLVLVLGLACIVVGTVFGTFCGVNIAELPWIPDWLKSCMIVGKFPGTNYDKQMILSLLIGVVHISIAMTVKALNQTSHTGFKENLSAWGWWLYVVGGSVTGLLAYMEVITLDTMKVLLYAIGGVGAVGIYLLNNIHRNPLVNIGAGLYDTYNMASGLMGDILSYIRLYALGLAGGMLGATFNNLAMMTVDNDPMNGGFALIGFLLIIVFGHILNIAMSCLSAFVHPLRLSFVEYFKNAGYEGKGVEYRPFQVEK
ncbi:MAG: ATPase V, partial [Bacteroidaceae bacterium]|nr:ATPase V [Bacteroidaceae bacterium]